ncbi:MAG: hypothetical protein OJF51_001187 [Nitrospira sp.]|jgi:hypothetical protein|nr:MAG: hypothetical protein OJF51_001187 [Nitrospira sp.]
MFKKAAVLTRPAPARQDAPLRKQGRSEVRDAKNNEAHGAMKKERHVCARRRVGEPAVSEFSTSARTGALGFAARRASR